MQLRMIYCFKILFFSSPYMLCLNIHSIPSHNCLHVVFNVILIKLYAETGCEVWAHTHTTRWDRYHFILKTSRTECTRGCFHNSNSTCTENQIHFYLKRYFLHLEWEVGMLHHYPHSERTLCLPFNMLQFYQCYILYFSNK